MTKSLKRFWKNVDKALLSSVTVLVFFLLGLPQWFFRPSDSVPMWLFIVCFIAFYAVCIVIYAVCSGEESVVYRLPQVRAIKRYSNHLIFLLEKSDLFSLNALVTIAYQNEDDEIETILGRGYVETINTQGCAQVVFDRKVNEERAKTIIKGLSNTGRNKRALRVKPFITEDLLNSDSTEDLSSGDLEDE